MSSELFQRAVKLARDGRKDEARAVLKRILALNPRHEGAWLWLVDCQATEADRIRVLEECLHILPNSQAARRVLQMLRAHQIMGEVEQQVETYSDDAGLEMTSISREPSPLFSYSSLEAGAQSGEESLSSVSPFTVPPEEVTEDELHGAVSNLSAILGTDLVSIESESPIAVEPTQPIRIKPRSSMPSEDEIKDLFDKAEEYQPVHTKNWSPTFSDDGVGRPRRASENLKTRPRSALDSIPTRPRPTATELINRPLFVAVDQTKSLKDPLLPVSGGSSAPPSFLGRWLTPRHIFVALAAGAGMVFFLLFVIVVLLVLG